jgi:hypothetical protein
VPGRSQGHPGDSCIFLCLLPFFPPSPWRLRLRSAPFPTLGRCPHPRKPSPGPALTCAATLEPRATGRSTRRLGVRITRAVGRGGRAQPTRGLPTTGARLSPRRSGPGSGRERRRAAAQHPGAPGRGRKAAARVGKSGGAGRARPPPGLRIGGPGPGRRRRRRWQRLGARLGPSPAGARAEAGEARQHPPPARRASQPSPGAGAAH